MEAEIEICDVGEGQSLSPELINENVSTIDSQKCGGRGGISLPISSLERSNKNLTSIDFQNQNDDVRVENVIIHGNDKFVLSATKEDDESVAGK